MLEFVLKRSLMNRESIIIYVLKALATVSPHHLAFEGDTKICYIIYKENASSV